MDSNKSLQKKKIKQLKYENYDTLHKNLDEFIQSCLNKYKFVDPKKEFYDVTGENKDFIISHKSTIPDLVIWNKTFNKNECFEEGDLSKSNPFPRYKFFLHLKNSNGKKRADNTSNTSNTSDKDDISMDKINLKEDNCIKKKQDEIKIEEKCEDIKMNKSSQSNKIKNVNELKKTENNFSNINRINTNSNIIKSNIINSYNQPMKNNNINLNNNVFLSKGNYSNNNGKYFPRINNDQNIRFQTDNIFYMPFNNNFYQINPPQNIYNNNVQMGLNLVPHNYNSKSIQNSLYYDYKYMNNNQVKNMDNFIHQNKFSFPHKNKNKKSMNDYYQKQFKQNELLMNFVYSYLQIKGWRIFKNNGNYISNFTSFELFTFLTERLKNNNDIKMFIVGMSNESMIFNGEQIYIILSQTLPIILQKKQNELMQNEIFKKQRIMKENEDKNLSNRSQMNNNNDMSKIYMNNNIMPNKDISSDNENIHMHEQNDIDNYNFNLYNGQNLMNYNEENNRNVNGDSNNKNSEEKKYKININDDRGNEYEKISNNLFMKHGYEGQRFGNFDSSIFGTAHQ